VCWRTDRRGMRAEHDRMKPTVSPFTAMYTEWLDSFRALLPGGWSAAPSTELTTKAAHKAAVQEWEHEGGSIKPAPKAAGQEPETKIPF